jgi:hypothetical protein
VPERGLPLPTDRSGTFPRVIPGAEEAACHAVWTCSNTSQVGLICVDEPVVLCEAGKGGTAVLMSVGVILAGR